MDNILLPSNRQVDLSRGEMVMKHCPGEVLIRGGR